MRPLSLLVLLTLTPSLPAGDWPAFLGPNGLSQANDSGYPDEWSKETGIKWSVKLDNPGNGSPIIVGDRIYLASSSSKGRTRSLICFSRTDGGRLWEKSVSLDSAEETHKTNPHGSTTPVSDGQRIVVWHGSGGTHCYDLDGELLWSRDLGTFHHIWGYASSPIIHDGKVIQLCGPGERQFLIALDLESGETLWQLDEPGGSASDKGRYIGSWATPVIINHEGREQVLCGLPTRVVGVDPTDGSVIWSCDGVNSDRADLMYTTPLYADGFVVALGGFGGPAMGIRLSGMGNITESGRLWHKTSPEGSPRNPQRIGSGIIIDGYVYLANADGPGSIECFEMRTGEQQWMVRRTSDGPHWASIIMADGKLYATGQKGVTRVFEPNPHEYIETAENDLGEQTNATPAASDGEFFIRTWDSLTCISGRHRPDK